MRKAKQLTIQLFEQALGIRAPWYVTGVDFTAEEKRLTIHVDFAPGVRFTVKGPSGEHRVHDTVVKRHRRLSFFEHDCYLEALVPRCKLPDGRVRQVSPGWEGALSGFTLLFEALVVALCQRMSFSGAGRMAGISAYQAIAICKTYVNRSTQAANYSAVERVAVDETSRARGHDCVTVAADADARRVIFVAEGRDSGTVEELAAELKAHGGDTARVKSVSIDMSPASIKGVGEHLPSAQITFDKYHGVAKAGAALDETRRKEQRTDRSIKGLRWKLLRDTEVLDKASRAELDGFTAQVTTKRTAHAWLYKEQLREILARKQVNVVRGLLDQWCANVMRSTVEPMKAVAAMARNHMEGIVAWSRTRQTNGFLEAINELFQAAKRRARGYTNSTTIRAVTFLIAGKLDFSVINLYCR